MSLTLIIILILCSIILLILELLIIPGGIVGISALILMIYAIVRAFLDLGNQVGIYVAVSSVIVTIVAIRISFSSKAWKSITHKGEINSKANNQNDKDFKIGDTGKTLSELRPMGNAMINDQVIEVTTTGFVIRSNQMIVITDIRDFKIFVEKLEIV